MILYFLISLFFYVSQGQVAEKHVLEAYTFQEADSLMNHAPKNLVVFFHADWCVFCENMQATTFKNENLVSKLNSDFFFISFDVEYPDDISYNGVKYPPSATDYHHIVQAISGKQRCVLPYLSIINAKNEVLFSSEGFMEAESLLEILQQLD